MRLDKFLCETGAGTRSEVKKLIAKGSVSVNGMPVKDAGARISEETDRVELCGAPVLYKAFEYYMLYKPAGVISASKADLRDKNTRCVVDLIETKCRNDLFPVGRLDKDTEGLLLITNDGALAHRLLSPRKHVWKTYYAELSAPLSDEDIRRLEGGVDIGDETPTLPCEIRLTEPGNPLSIRISIREGRYHQIKRMMEACGSEVTYLKRLSMGPLMLDETLSPGAYRELKEDELAALLSL
ncbi:MAG: pseudouridine synthase [Eubacteriales bacterium]|nr:pseudouridine synthase [Eubacteriales bacterium]